MSDAEADATGASGSEQALERAILDLLDQRAPGVTICPSEAARAVHAASRPDESGGSADDGWRALMEPARAAARRLVAEGRVEITQRGEAVDPATARGPIRIRRVD